MIPLISGICIFDIYSNKTETKLESVETIFSYIFLIIVVLVVGYFAFGGEKNRGKDWTPISGFLGQTAGGCIIVIVIIAVLLLLGFVVKMCGIR